MPADRRSFQDTLEPVLYWDTSFAIPDLFEEEPNHIECRDFAARLHGEASLSLVSDFVLDELAFWAVKGEFALLPTDDYHIATALDSGVNAFVTLDQDFLDVEGIIVYTCLS